MINKANEDEKKPTEMPLQQSGYTDVAKIDINCHLLIKDKDTSEILVNKRG